MNVVIRIISAVCGFLWGDLITIPLPGGGGVGISLLVILLIPTGLYFTIRTRFLPIRMFPEMLRITAEKRTGGQGGAISGVQALIVSTATRVGMGNLIGVVAAISAGGAGAVFWMWLSALIGSSTAFIEAVLAQVYKEKDPLYGGYRGGPAYYIHVFAERKRGGGKRRYSVVAVLFALSGLICWCGISQVISNSVSSAFQNAFSIPPLWTTVVLVVVSAVIVLRKNATVKVLDILVPIMAVCYFVITLVLIGMNIQVMPSVLQRIFQEAFGLRQAVAGGFGAVKIGTASGDIDITGSVQELRCSSASGDVEADLQQMPVQMDVASKSGDCEITLPGGEGFALQFSTVSGELYSDFTLVGPIGKRSGEAIYLDGGGRTFRMSSISGDITLRQQ